MDLSSVAAGRLYDAAKTVSQPDALAPGALPGVAPADAPDFGVLAGDQTEGVGFADAVGAVANDMVDTLMAGEQTAQDMMAGRADAQAVVEALAATEMALEMAVAVRDKVVAAYQEILRMPV
ncbi:MAG: flagellar hook-basal body complex protein FliE [Pseudomonadota bacterium]